MKDESQPFFQDTCVNTELENSSLYYDKLSFACTRPFSMSYLPGMGPAQMESEGVVLVSLLSLKT